MDLIIGPHIDRNKSFSDSITKMKDCILNRTNFEITAMAMFVAGPRTFNVNIDDCDIEFIKNNNLQVFVHNTYLSVPWKGTDMAIRSLKKQLELCHQINAKGFIIHLPKNESNDTIIKQLKEILNHEIAVCIYLETPAISKGSVFHCPNRLNSLFSSIKQELDPNEMYFGLCIDTAHIWSSGVDISDYSNARDWLNDLNIKNIMFHLNDNVRPLGVAPDQHQALMEGEIWKSYKGTSLENQKKSGLYAVLQYAQDNKCPIILERKMDNNFFQDYLIINDILP